MAPERHKSGREAENLASKYISNRGYQIIERNWSPGRWGEIDIIARDGETLVFVEVRFRGASARVSPQQSITRKKLTVLRRTAKLYAKTHPELPQALRIDLAAVSDQGIKLFKNISDC